MHNKIHQLPLAVSLPDDETFLSFISADNFAAIAQIQQFISSGVNINEPHAIYLFGSQRVGKSHLLHASSTCAVELGKSSVCLSCSELSQLPVQVIDNLETIDVVCLDDIQLISSNIEWQRALFDLYNRMLEHGKQLIISGNAPVQDLSISLPDLSSRLSWGHIIQIKPLSDDDKIQAIKSRAKQRGLSIQQEAAKFLVNHYSRDMKDLMQCLVTLDGASISEQRKITIPFIKQVMPCH